MEISTKKYRIWELVLKINWRLSILPLFTGQDLSQNIKTACFLKIEKLD